MTRFADHISAPAVRALVDACVDAVWRGRRTLIAAHGAPADLRVANVPAPGLRYALTCARRLLRLVRLVFFIAAAWLVLPPAVSRARGDGMRPASTRAATRGFRLTRAWTRSQGGDTLQPPHLRDASCDAARTLARHLEALAAVLLAPDAHVRRIARSLQRGDVVVLGVAPRRLPRRDRRHHLDDIAAALDQAREERRARRWLRDDSS
jgi:hypothetical protein